jgi:LysR family glycine cleavage system transcriptional activator
MDSLVAAMTAVRLGSFSATALELGITHAAVSRRIAIAEEWAGLRLFDRHGRGVVPTPNGQRVLARVEVALDQIANLGAGPKMKRGVPSVRLAVTPSFARFWLLPRLKSLESDPPDVTIQVLADLKHADLPGGEVDLAIRYGRGGWRAGSEERLFAETLVPVATKDLLAPTGLVKATDIIRLPLLHGGDTTNWRAWIAEHADTFRPKPVDRIFVDYSLAIDAASAGLGVALWNQSLHGVADGLIAVRKFEVTSPLAYYLLSRAGDAHSPAALVARRIRSQIRSKGPTDSTS